MNDGLPEPGLLLKHLVFGILKEGDATKAAELLASPEGSELSDVHRTRLLTLASALVPTEPRKIVAQHPIFRARGRIRETVQRAAPEVDLSTRNPFPKPSIWDGTSRRDVYRSGKRGR